MGERLALGTVSVAARVIHRTLVPAAVTLVEVTAEGGGSTLSEVANHLVLDGLQPVRAGIALTVQTQDLSKLRRPARLSGRRRRCTHDDLLGRGIDSRAGCPDPFEQVWQGAPGAKGRVHEMEITCRGLDRSMSEQGLKRVDLDSGLQHLGRKGVTKHMDSAGLVDFRPALGMAERLLDRARAEMASCTP